MKLQPWYLPDRNVADRIKRAEEVRAEAYRLLGRLEQAIALTDTAWEPEGGADDDGSRRAGDGETPVE